MNSASPFWKTNLRKKADELSNAIAQTDKLAFTAALNGYAQSRIVDFLAGVQAYHNHPYRRSMPTPTCIWQEGSTCLYDYGGPEGGPVVLAVPSLINKAFILDLSEDRSLLRDLAQNGCRVFLLDWGCPDQAEKDFSVDDYILQRLHRAVVELVAHHQRPIHLLGYCMGGNLCLAYASLFPFAVQSLILLATPWDFHSDPAMRTRIQLLKPVLDLIIQQTGHLPIDVLQSLFASLDPVLIQDKFIRFSHINPNSEKARFFVALEDWLNDGVPLAQQVARTCLFDWFEQNTPGRNQWQVAGHNITPQTLPTPTYLLIPETDRIVPPESALALHDALPNSTLSRVSSGHITMTCGPKAKSQTYDPICKWLKKNTFT